MPYSFELHSVMYLQKMNMDVKCVLASLLFFKKKIIVIISKIIVKNCLLGISKYNFMLLRMVLHITLFQYTLVLSFEYELFISILPQTCFI